MAPQSIYGLATAADGAASRFSHRGRCSDASDARAKGGAMILRLWRGWTTREGADPYERIVREVLASIAARRVPGYRGSYLLRRELGDEIQFATILLFDSMDAVRAFAGEDHEIAYVPEQARQVLARFDERSAHFEVLLTPQAQ
jgi:heme-degrading monooxygenase HmoA